MKKHRVEKFVPNEQLVFVRDFRTWYKHYIRVNKINTDSLNRPEKQLKCAVDFYYYCLDKSSYLLPIPLLTQKNIVGNTQINAFLTVVIDEFRFINKSNYMGFLKYLLRECVRSNQGERGYWERNADFSRHQNLWLTDNSLYN